VTINGKPAKAIVGQKVSVVAAGARVKISYDCRSGDCGTCTVKMNGRKVKACQMNIPKVRNTMYCTMYDVMAVMVVSRAGIGHL
jgi:aerobic-type carbon monoxide dehydrogenase small subunit (CoxS/CutS family)